MESTSERDEVQVEERVVGARVGGEAGDSFKDEAVTVEELGDNGSQRGEDTSGIRLPFAGTVVGERLTGEAHEEKVNVRKVVVEGEMGGVATDDLVARFGERDDVVVDFDDGVRKEAN